MKQEDKNKEVDVDDITITVEVDSEVIAGVREGTRVGSSFTDSLCK